MPPVPKPRSQCTRDTAEEEGEDGVGQTYLALVVCAVGRVLQRALQSSLVVAAPQQLAYLAGEGLDIGGGDGGDCGGEGAEVEVGGGVRVEGVNVDCAPVDVGHDGGGVLGRLGGQEQGREGCWWRREARAGRECWSLDGAGDSCDEVAKWPARGGWLQLPAGWPSPLRAKPWGRPPNQHRNLF